jgi:rod shape-determining protein MreC
MRKLLTFLIYYRNLFLFLLLELIAFGLIVRQQSFQRASFTHSATKVSGKVLEGYDQLDHYLSLDETNHLLLEENAELRSRLELQQTPPIAFDTTFATILPGDSFVTKQYHFIDAEVINNSYNKRNNYLTLNRGSRHGIKKGMGVICPTGVVGIVRNVSENYATVLSVLHKNAMISAQIKNSRHFGSLIWPGDDYRYAILNDIPKEASLNIGDTVQTNAYSSIFPPGITIGTIKHQELRIAANFYDINITLSNDFGNLHYVYVVENILKEEQTSIEDDTQND